MPNKHRGDEEPTEKADKIINICNLPPPKAQKEAMSAKMCLSFMISA